MNSKAQTIQEMFTRIAPRYDLLNRTLSGSTDRRWRKKAVQSLPQHSSAHILDLCAGTLDLTLEVLKQNPGAQITALDFSEAMLRAGEPKIPSAQCAQVQLKVGDGMDLQLSHSFFDGVVCGFGMRNIVDNFKSLQEIYQVLKPGGTLVVLEFFKPESWFSRLFYATYGKWIIPKIGGWISKDPEAYGYLFQSIQGYHSVETFTRLMQKTGFVDVHHKPLTGGVAEIVVGKKD